MLTMKSAAILMLLSSEVSATSCKSVKSYKYVDTNACNLNNVMPLPPMLNYSVDQCFL